MEGFDENFDELFEKAINETTTRATAKIKWPKIDDNKLFFINNTSLFCFPNLSIKSLFGTWGGTRTQSSWGMGRVYTDVYNLLLL